MNVAAAWLIVAVLAALAIMQVLLVCGAPLGRLAWGGQHRVLPRRLRVGSAIAVALYAGFAALVLSRAGILAGGESGFVVVMTWVLLGYFTLGIVMNLISRSAPERWTMTPTCLVLAVATWIVAIG